MRSDVQNSYPFDMKQVSESPIGSQCTCCPFTSTHYANLLHPKRPVPLMIFVCLSFTRQRLSYGLKGTSRTETVGADSLFQMCTHAKGKSESMWRGEIWSVPRFTRLPDITVPRLTLSKIFKSRDLFPCRHLMVHRNKLAVIVVPGDLPYSLWILHRLEIESERARERK